jgi:DNA polymerase-4
VEPEHVESFLAPLPIRRLWGIGPVLAERLSALSIGTIGELAAYPQGELSRVVGNRAAELQALARGHDAREVEAERAPKSFGEENTFEVDVSQPDKIAAALTAHSEAVARRLRRAGYRGRTITIKIKLAQARRERVSRHSDETEPVYPLLTRSRTLRVATDDGALVRRVALELWSEAGVLEPVRLIGVSLSNLESRTAEQLELFGGRREDRLGPALDAITERFGAGAIARAVDAPQKITHSSRRKQGEP